MKVCITIDMDNFQDYARLVASEGQDGDLSFYDSAVPRFLDLFDGAGVRATFFMIGRDAASSAHRAAVREIADRGHEVGNHSFTHPYNFRALTRARKEAEIDQGEAAIADICGRRPAGFRTPSFDVDLETLELLRERGYVYDSSVMPSPIMWVFMLYGKLFIRRSDYQLGHPTAVLAPTRPYLPSAERLYRPAPAGDSRPPLLEIPCSVVSPFRIPFYATVLRLLGPRALDLCVRLHGRSRPLLHTLFHLLDAAEIEGSALDAALSRTPGIGVPVERRHGFLDHATSALADAGEAVTLCEFARGFLNGRAPEGDARWA